MAEVIGASGGSTPTGTVAFEEGSTEIGSADLVPVINTNFLLYSSLFDQAGIWYTEGDGTYIITPNYSVSPIGDQSACRFQVSTDSNWAALFQVVSDLAGTAPVTFSVWLKSNTGDVQDVHLEIDDIYTYDSTEVPVFVTSAWQRFWVAIPRNSIGVQVYIQTGFGAEQLDISMWGAQVEESSSSGPYVSTTTSPGTATVGVATFTTDELANGSRSITAAYSGNGNYSPSTSAPLLQQVNQVVITTFNPLVNALAGTPYSTMLTAVGGTPPYTWAIVAGSLPDGLSLSSDGTISGTPTGNSGGLRFAVQVTDSSIPPDAVVKEFELDLAFTFCPMRRVRPNDPCDEGGAFLPGIYPNQSAAGTNGQNITLFACLAVDGGGSMGTATLNLPSGFTEVGQPVITGLYQVTIQGVVDIASSAQIGANQISVHQQLDGCQWDSGTQPYYVRPPTVTFAPLKGIPKGKSRTVTVTITPSPTSAIRLKLSVQGGTSGAATFANGDTNLTINQTEDVPITGSDTSSTADNITLTAAALDSDGNEVGEPLAMLHFSVVWVTLSLGSDIPDDNSAKAAYEGKYLTTSLDPFASFELSECGTPVQPIGSVMPANYSGAIVLMRALNNWKEWNGCQYMTGDSIPVDDTSDPQFRDDDPQSGGSAGTIYDLDVPAVNNVSYPHIIRARQNFVEYVVLDSTENSLSNPLQNRIASNQYPYYSVLSCTATDQGLALNYDYPGDNIVASGTTALSCNLQ